MSTYYDTMQVCKKWGHKITAFYRSSPEGRQKHCDKCGSETTHVCEHCQNPIRGFYHVEGVIGGSSPEVPLYCHDCGRSYPWKGRLLLKRFAISLVKPFQYLVDAIVGIFKK